MANTNLDVNHLKKESLKDLGIKLNECMMSQSVFVIIGVFIGTSVGYRIRSYMPLIIGTGIGTIADYSYGRLYKCKELADNYEKLKKMIDIVKENN